MTKIMIVHCNAGHDFEIPSRRGRPPKWCNDHKPAVDGSKGIKIKSGGNPSGPESANSESKKEGSKWELQRELHCELGDHDWLAPVQRGRAPRNCPDHRPDKSLPSPKSSQTVSKIMKKVLESPGAVSCRCGLTAETTREELRALGGGCSDPHHVCPTVDMARRMIGN